MKRALGVVFSCLLVCCFNFSTFSPPSFAASLSAPRTLRVDYYHTGNSHDEWFSLDRVVLEPLEWPGNLNKSIDESQLGEYLFEVRERGSGKLLYSRGFNSVFGEWKTTEEALHGNRTFSEALRCPSPEGAVGAWRHGRPFDKLRARSRPPRGRRGTGGDARRSTGVEGGMEDGGRSEGQVRR